MDLEGPSGLSWLREMLRGVKGAGLSHRNTKLKLLEVYKNIKIPPAILSCNIHVDTTQTTMSIFFSFFSFFWSFHVRSGSDGFSLYGLKTGLSFFVF